VTFALLLPPKRRIPTIANVTDNTSRIRRKSFIVSALHRYYKNAEKLTTMGSWYYLDV
jgi:hypothetical protein